MKLSTYPLAVVLLVLIAVAKNLSPGKQNPKSLDLNRIGTFEGDNGTIQVRPMENTTSVISCEGSTTYGCASLSVRVRVHKR